MLRPQGGQGGRSRPARELSAAPQSVFDRLDNDAHHPWSTRQASPVERCSRVDAQDQQRRKRRRDERGLVSVGRVCETLFHKLPVELGSDNEGEAYRTTRVPAAAGPHGSNQRTRPGIAARHPFGVSYSSQSRSWARRTCNRSSTAPFASFWPVSTVCPGVRRGGRVGRAQCDRHTSEHPPTAQGAVGARSDMPGHVHS